MKMLSQVADMARSLAGINISRRRIRCHENGIDIAELLGRPSIELSNARSAAEFSGAVVMVTGAAGSIGSEICRQLCAYPVKKLVLLDQAETALHDIHAELREAYPGRNIMMELASIRERRRIEKLVDHHSPAYIFHAAAYKHVPILEDFPREVILTNIMGTRIMADAAIRAGVKKFVMVSSDKAVNPTNIMGASKRIAEMYVQTLSAAADTQFITTRFGNVLGSNGSVVPIFRKQIEKGGPVTVTHPNITRYFMTIPEASSLVLEAAVMGNGGEIFVFDMGKPVKIVDLAEKMITMYGKTPGKDVRIEYVGLRPGEKMFEELFLDKENLLPTHHPKIMRAAKQMMKIGLIEKISELIDMAEEDGSDLVRQIRNMLPEFSPRHENAVIRFIPIPKQGEDTITQQAT